MAMHFGHASVTVWKLRYFNSPSIRVLDEHHFSSFKFHFLGHINALFSRDEFGGLEIENRKH